MSFMGWSVQITGDGARLSTAIEKTTLRLLIGSPNESRMRQQPR